MVFKFVVNQDSIIYSCSGFIDHDKNTLLLNQKYFAYYSDVSKRNHEEEEAVKAGTISERSTPLFNEVIYVTTHKEYDVPVLNRGSKLVFFFLTGNNKGLVPSIEVLINHKSVKLIDYEDEEKVILKYVIYLLIISLIIFGCGITYLLNTFWEQKEIVIYTGILGIAYSAVGALILYIIHQIRKFFA